jgi:hypothetical protein
MSVRAGRTRREAVRAVCVCVCVCVCEVVVVVGIGKLCVVQEILPLPEENAVDLHSTGSPLTLAIMVGGKHTYRYCQKQESLSLRDFRSTGRHLSGVSFITSLKSDICTGLTTQNTTENKCIISHAQTTTAIQSHVFFNVIHRLLATGKGGSDFLRANHCQGQLQTPQSKSVLVSKLFREGKHLMCLTVRPSHLLTIA